MTRLLTLALALTASAAVAQTDKPAAPKKDAAPKPAGPPPTAADVAYGPHPRQKLDFWRAKADAPTPVVVFIHGGGWINGDKNTFRGADAYLKKGVSVAAINYRRIQKEGESDTEPPVRAPLEDAARAVQFVRSKAKEWNLDKTRVGATGGSAGACSSLWLAFHDDLADPKSTDPVARESTRLTAVAVSGAQTTLDPKVTREWMPNYRYGGHAFLPKGTGERDGGFQGYYEKREKLLPLIVEYSPISHVTKDDPPVFLEYPSQDPKITPAKGDSPKDPTHSPLLGMILMEKLKAEGVEGILVYPGKADEKYKTSADFLTDRLKAKKAS
jgi:acetyl esterase/lipase